MMLHANCRAILRQHCLLLGVHKLAKLIETGQVLLVAVVSAAGAKRQFCPILVHQALLSCEGSVSFASAA